MPVVLIDRECMWEYGNPGECGAKGVLDESAQIGGVGRQRPGDSGDSSLIGWD